MEHNNVILINIIILMWKVVQLLEVDLEGEWVEEEVLV